MKIAAKLFVLVGFAFAMYGCPSKVSEPKHLEGIDYPEWVLSGSGAFGGDSKVFSGVGSVNGIKNESLARTTAANRARNEIAKIFNVYSASLMKDYMASGSFARGRDHQIPIPFGPYLAAAGWISLLYGEQLNKFYFSIL